MQRLNREGGRLWVEQEQEDHALCVTVWLKGDLLLFTPPLIIINNQQQASQAGAAHYSTLLKPSFLRAACLGTAAHAHPKVERATGSS